MTGTLEALLVTQTEIPTIIISSSIYSFLFATLRVIIFLVIGVLIYGLDLTRANYLGALIILIISIISFSSFGILSASFVMVLKKGDPVAGIFNGISWLLGGVYYPIAILPVWLRAFSYFIPVTYSLEGMRLALLKGASCYQLLPNILSLLAFTAVLMPLSIYAFQYAIRLAKRDGSLTHY
jgi:ABC-2 type transport system permease protein